MLESLREASTGWLAKILLVVLVASFAVWGISGSLFFGANNTVVEVGETSVGQNEYRFAYEVQLGALSQQLNRRITRQEAELFGMRQTVLNQVVSSALLDDTALKMGLGVSDEQLAKAISEDKGFADLTGNFSRAALSATLREYRITEDEYIETRRQVALRNQILEGSAQTLKLPDTFSNALSVFQNEKRTFQYVEIGDEAVLEKPEPKEDDLTKYYEENKQNYKAPEYRKANLIILQAKDLSKPDEITQEELQSEYEARKPNLKSPEKRKIQQLVFKSKEEAEKAKEQLAAGESYEAIVEASGKTLKDVDLGLVTLKALPDKAISEAAFSAALNEPTDIIDGLFGPVILRITEIQPEKTPSLEEVSEQIRNEIALRRAGETLYDLFDDVEAERGAGELLPAIADKLKLTSRTIEAVDAQGRDMEGKPVTDVPELRKLLGGIFESEPGDDTTQAIEIGSDGYLWYEVSDVIAERQKPFEEVKDQVKVSWILSETDKKIKEIADKIEERIKAGEEFDTVLGDSLPTDSLGKPVTSLTSTPLKRTAKDGGLPAPVISAGFGIAIDDVTTANSGPQKWAVLKVTKVDDSETPPLAEDELERLNELGVNDVLSQLVQHLQNNATVYINQAAVDLALSNTR